MYSTLYCCCAIAASMVFPVVSGRAQSPDKQSTDNLKRQFIQAVERMESVADGLVVRATVEMLSEERGGSSPGRRDWKYEIACRGNRFLLKKEIVDKGGITVERISARNDAYFFIVDKSPSGTELVFVQQISHRDKGNSGVDGFVRSLAVRYPISSYQYVLFPLWEFITLPGFEVLEVQELGSSLVRVVHTVSPEYEPEGIELRDTYMICDSSKGWAVLEHGQTNTYPATPAAVDTIKHQVLDSSLRGDFCFVNERRMDLTRRDGSYSMFTELKSTVLEGEPSEEIFYLSHYGLPEPDFPRSWSRFNRWFLLIAFICAVCWRLMVWRSRAAA